MLPSPNEVPTTDELSIERARALPCPAGFSSKAWRDDWQMVVACLHSDPSPLSAEERFDVRTHADGFGGYASIYNLAQTSQEEAQSVFWDWSNVRDSTPFAVSRMAYVCRTRIARRVFAGESAR